MPSQIKNKHKREEVYLRMKKAQGKVKRERRAELRKVERDNPELKEQRLKENVPATLENTREYDATVVGVDEDGDGQGGGEDAEVVADEAEDELASYFVDGVAPKVVVTTSPKAHAESVKFAMELSDMIPTADYVRRGNQNDLKKIVQYCINREYTDLMVIKEDHGEPTALTLIHLPNGPTAHFRLTSVVRGKEIEGHARATEHNPELILNGFSTRLGRTVARMFAALFPQVPEFQGRQSATFHNQRDFIFFRRHRYVFKNGKKVDLQEIGPRFTLKLKWLQRGTFDPKNGEYEWKFKQELETSKRRFFL
ncbi:Brix-domain-containing protein [Ramicandelaber brevisporus]|nr:Brix-domain-containing protein [Ramicandelaber brevisporus]